MAEPLLKIVAFITREHDGQVELLAFVHPEADYFTRPDPPPWYQLPAGTGEPGETPEQAALREVQEESGLSQFAVVRHLGAYDDPPWGIRHVFHLVPAGEVAERWVHVVANSGAWDDGMRFHYEWLPLAACEPQLGDFNGRWLPLVRNSLATLGRP